MVKIDRTQLHFREGKFQILNKKAVFDGLEQLTTTTTRHTDHNKLKYNISLQITISLRRYEQTYIFWSALPTMTSVLCFLYVECVVAGCRYDFPQILKFQR